MEGGGDRVKWSERRKSDFIELKTLTSDSVEIVDFELMTEAYI